MPKYTFDKSAKKATKQHEPKPISKTEISKPQQTYDPAKVELQMDKSTIREKKNSAGRPKSGRKSYQVVRLQKKTVLKINALENALGIKTQDKTVERALDRVVDSLSSDEKRAYELWLEMFEKKSFK